MLIWYFQSTFRTHERNNYLWQAMKEVWEKAGHRFRACDRSGFRYLGKSGEKADVAFVAGPQTFSMLSAARVNLRKQVRLSCYFGGGGWRRSQRPHFTAMKKFDVVLLSHQVHYEKYKKLHPNVFVVIHGFDPQVFYPSDEEAAIGIYFCGNFGAFGRVNRLAQLSAKFPGQVLWEQGKSHVDMSSVLRRCKIGWNQIARGPQTGISCNLRVWEVLGSEALLFCSYSKHVPLRDGKHCIFWHNTQDMLDKAEYYLREDGERKRIARQGYEEAMGKHTWVHRAQEYKKIVEKYL